MWKITGISGKFRLCRGAKWRSLFSPENFFGFRIIWGNSDQNPNKIGFWPKIVVLAAVFGPGPAPEKAPDLDLAKFQFSDFSEIF